MRGILAIMIAVVWVFVFPIKTSALTIINPETVIEQDTLSLPKVFQLGDYESQFEKLSAAHQKSLLTATDDDFDAMFQAWTSMLKEMQAHSELVNYDLKGIKMWLNVFWDKNGKIKHIAFFLKPNSKNVDRVELGAFLTDFMNNYTFPVTSDDKFSHYSGASFPLFTWKKKQ